MVIAIAMSLLAPPQGRAVPIEVELKVDGVARQAIAYPPTKATPSPIPLVIAFHGHFGRSRSAARSYKIQEAWPEAMVIYPQGLPTPSRLDSQGKAPGWQKEPGEQSDRDLHLYDQLLVWAKSRAEIDGKRIFVVGHSNGGGFAYLLFRTRRDTLAAIAPVAAGMVGAPSLQPLPVIHVAGRQDTTVPFRGQMFTVARVKAANGCSETSEPFGPLAQIFRGKEGNDLGLMVWEGGHAYPPGATGIIVRFFKEHPKK